MPQENILRKKLLKKCLEISLVSAIYHTIETGKEETASLESSKKSK